MSFWSRITGRDKGRGTLPLDGNGERVDVVYSSVLDFDALDVCEKSHCRRYQYAAGLVSAGDACGDFACGTGYGSVMLAKNACRVVGVDIDPNVIQAVRSRYVEVPNVEFIHSDLLSLSYESEFDMIVSFETIEHFSEDEIGSVFSVFARALKPGGRLVLSVPYMQLNDKAAKRLGFHATFLIDENKIESWLRAAGLRSTQMLYQDLETHCVKADVSNPHSIVCVARKSEVP